MTTDQKIANLMVRTRDLEDAVVQLLGMLGYPTKPPVTPTTGPLATVVNRSKSRTP